MARPDDDLNAPKGEAGLWIKSYVLGVKAALSYLYNNRSDLQKLQTDMNSFRALGKLESQYPKMGAVVSGYAERIMYSDSPTVAQDIMLAVDK
jgi:hypothetical protein